MISIAGLMIILAISGNSLQQKQDAEYLLGSHTDGRKAYLLTDTVEYFTKMHEDGEETGYTCTVKNVSANSAVDYDYYEIRWYQTEALIKNGEGYGMRGMSQIYDMPDSIEMRLIKYLRERRDKNPDELTHEDKEKFGRLIMCGYWEGTDGYNLNISTEKISKIDSRKYETVDEFNYSIRSISDDNDKKIIRAEFIQGGSSFQVDLTFKDINHMTLKNYQTKETLTYRAQTEPYPQHLDDDLRYILLYGRMGFAYYMDLSTLKVVDEHNWNVEIVPVNADKNERGENILMKFFIKGQPFTLAGNGEWVSVDVDNTHATNMLRRNAFLTSYYYVFGRNHGSRF